MDRLVLFGGTFDPIHNAHLHIADFVNKELKATVCFVIAKNPRWKTPSASIKDRLNMLEIAVNSLKNKSLTISSYEITNNHEINYSIDTVRHFKNMYQNKELYFLIGLDQVESFDKWKDANKLSKLAKIIFVTRPGVVIDNENVKTFNMLNLKYEKNYEISSSSIRSLNNLDVPYEVIKYIENNNLYYINKVKGYYSDKRFKHAISVANLAYQIAKSNNLSIANRCYIAGLLHDIAKTIDINKAKELMKINYPKYVDDVVDKLYHQFLAIDIIKDDFKINDDEILDAIMYHATGKANMNDISKIVYSADKIDPTRGYDSSEMIEECKKDFNKGFIRVLKENKEYLVKKNLSINNSLTKECIKYYLGE